MDDSTVANADQRHHFSFASEVYDLYRNHDGAVDFNPDIPDTYDRISPKEEQVCIPYYDIDTKWRCVAIGNPLQLLSRHERLSSDDLQFGKKIDLESKSVPSIYKIEVFPTDKGNSVDDYDPDRLQNRNHAINIPEEPFLLFLSHFETCVPFGHVSDLIERTFELFPEISYEFVAEECLWNAVYLKGSSHCKMQINVYTRGSNYIVEGNRLSGDSSAFRAVFNELKVTIQTAYVEAKCHDSIAIDCPQPLNDLPEIDSEDALKSVLLMAKSGKFESQLVASRLICDLSLHDNMQQLICDSGCLRSLVEDLLPLKTCEWTHQHALIALANLSEAQSCQSAMIDAGVLPALLELATDGPYHSAEVSRESARILANLSSCLATRVVHVLGPGAVLNWIGSVDMLRDERLKLHASRAKEFLIVAVI